MKIFIEDSFDSAHWLPAVPVGHKCRNLHGHTYRIRIELSGPVNPEFGWVMDYDEVKRAWAGVKSRLDHVCLNDVLAPEQPTCEVLAAWIGMKLSAQLPGIQRVELRETERCGAIWEASA